MSWRAFNVLPALAERFDVTYVTTGDEIPPAKFVAVRKLPKWRYMQFAGFSLSKCVDELHRVGQIDLAVAYGGIGFAIRKVPFVALEGGSVYREIQIFSAREPWHRRARFLAGFLHYALPEILSIRRARQVIVNSQTLKRDLMSLHRLPEDRISVVYNGLDQEYLNVFATRTKATPPRALFVGRLHFRKGILGLLEEFVRRPDLEMEMLVAGDGPDRSAIDQLAGSDRRIRPLGFVDRTELMRLLSLADIFVFPTHYEGFPSALLEAMGAGLACVAYDIPVMREVMGDAGMLVEPGAPGAIVDQMSALARDPEKIRACGEAAHRQATLFSWARCANEIARVVQEQAESLPMRNGARGGAP